MTCKCECHNPKSRGRYHCFSDCCNSVGQYPLLDIYIFKRTVRPAEHIELAFEIGRKLEDRSVIFVKKV